MKYITFYLSNGEKWGIPAEIVAKDRAAYYANHDAKDDPENYQKTYDYVYREEFEYTMNDEIEAVDYIQNNIDFEDIKDHLVKLEDNQESLESMFREAMAESQNISLEDIENG